VWAEKLEVRRAIVAMPEATMAERRRAMEAAVQAGLSVLTVPSLEDMLSGNVAVSQMRQVQLEDLLGRERVQLDDSGLRHWLGEHVVLITGAGGSIGSELVRQIARFQPRLLVLYELSEFALYQIEQEFSAAFPATPIACAVGDVKDADRLDQVFAAYRPSVVFHAAAYKHVPLMEGENSWEAVRNNVQGSKCVAEVSQRYDVEKMVLISTDKAVNPTNVMGATKRLAERVLCGLQKPEGTRFVTVRFGNVLGSNGSVIPKFREQIARGGPVTVTHPDIIRYFMLIPEAAQLVLQAGLMGQGGEIFVLEMGEPIRIVDLARDMIRLSGFTEDDIKIAFTGLRPGEKLFEELLTDSEHTLVTPHPKLRIARSEMAPEPHWQAALDDWLNGASLQTPAALKMRLKEFVPEYSPQL
jgi:FlaA1/EpsC-like NDP-sugar epimerase